MTGTQLLYSKRSKTRSTFSGTVLLLPGTVVAVGGGLIAVEPVRARGRGGHLPKTESVLVQNTFDVT